MIFWLQPDVKLALEFLQKKLQEYLVSLPHPDKRGLDEAKKLLATTEQLLMPDLPSGEEQNLARILPLFFSAFRVFEEYIFLASSTAVTIHYAIFDVFEMLTDFVAQYYWQIWALFDMKCQVAIGHSILATPVATTLRQMEDDNGNNLRRINSIVELGKPPYLRLVTDIIFLNFCQQHAGRLEQIRYPIVAKLQQLIKSIYTPLTSRRFESYPALLLCLQGLEFSPVNSQTLNISEFENVKMALISYYFHVLNDLIFTRLTSKYYDDLAIRKLLGTRVFPASQEGGRYQATHPVSSSTSIGKRIHRAVPLRSINTTVATNPVCEICYLPDVREDPDYCFCSLHNVGFHATCAINYPDFQEKACCFKFQGATLLFNDERFFEEVFRELKAEDDRIGDKAIKFSNLKSYHMLLKLQGLLVAQNRAKKSTAITNLLAVLESTFKIHKVGLDEKPDEYAKGLFAIFIALEYFIFADSVKEKLVISGGQLAKQLAKVFMVFARDVASDFSAIKKLFGYQSSGGQSGAVTPDVDLNLSYQEFNSSPAIRAIQSPDKRAVLVKALTNYGQLVDANKFLIFGALIQLRQTFLILHPERVSRDNPEARTQIMKFYFSILSSTLSTSEYIKEAVERLRIMQRTNSR